MKDHGLVLRAENGDYTDLVVFGSITISHHTGRGVEVIVSDFKFRHEQSCRENVTKSLCWARDVLDAAIKAQMLVPGGTSSISVCAD